MASKPKKEEQKQPGTEVSTDVNGGSLVLIQDQVPEHLQDKMQGARGSENVTQEDLVIPRLEIVQAISPEVTEGAPEYLPNAKPGDLINSVSKRIYGRESFVVPVHYVKQWLVWLDRNKGGGFRGAFPSPQEAEDKVKEEGGKAAGFEAIDTPTHFCLLVDRETGAVDEIVLSMPRTKAKISRQWNSMVKMAGGDRFSRVYRVTTQMEKNAKGQFYNFAIAQSGFPAKVLYDKAEKLYLMIKKGDKRVVMDTTGFTPGEPADHADADM